MGAFLLVSDEAGHFKKKEALETMGVQCGTDPAHFSFQGWELFLFPKRQVKTPNFHHNENNGVFVTGTPYFSGMNYSSTLDTLEEGMKSGRCNRDDLLGVYFLLAHKDNSLSFSTDPGGIYSIFYTADRLVISSSFLSLCSGLNSLTPDKETITENLATGSIIGGDTVFNEVKRFEPSNPVTFRGIRFAGNCPEVSKLQSRNKKESLKKQTEVLHEYFEGIKNFADEAGVDCGITGGLDSRLLLSLARNHFKSDNVQFHSHYRHNPDIDFLMGRELCKKLDVKFVSVPYREFSQLPKEDTESVIKRCMLFNDGQVRTHSFWHEEFNSAENLLLTLNDKSLALNGIGGEQYRNSERLILSRWNKVKWIENSLVRKNAGNSFFYERDEKDLICRLDDKISSRLRISGKQNITLMDIKRYMNEIYIPANRGIRTVNENRLFFSTMPFADFFVSRAAYESVEHLGPSLSYEAEMINLIDPEAASVGSSYGFAFNKTEPVTRYLPHVVFENFLPWEIKQKLSEKILKKNTMSWCNIIESNRILIDAVDTVRELSLPLNMDLLSRRKEMGPLVFAMGYLLNTFKDKIK